jgi:hypothetical protein
MLNDLRLRLRSFFRSRAVESDLNDELRFMDFCSADLQVGVFDFLLPVSNGRSRC